MVTLGDRIRNLRLQHGLSQKQLAAGDVTRALISQIENGRCTPSSQTLRILAERLGKPLSYFLEDSAAETYSVKFLWESAQQDAACGQWAAALPKVQQALQLSQRVEDPQQEAQLRAFYAKCLRELDRFEEALDEYEDLLDRSHTPDYSAERLKIWLEIGNCYLSMEQYSSARRIYRKVIRHSVAAKSLQAQHTRALRNLGTACWFLGDVAEAAVHYLKALESMATPEATPDLWGGTAAALGCSYRKLGRLDLAHHWCKRALERLRAARSPMAAGAQHNLALVLRDMGRWEESYALLQRSLDEFRSAGEAVYQANVMEDLVKYWLHKHEIDRAEQLCWQAIDLLTGKRGTRLRGLLYRHLGQIYRTRGEPARARELFGISSELFHHVRAADELTRTVQIIQEEQPPAEPPVPPPGR